MAKFSEQFIRQVAQATDIVEVVSQYVALKKAGKEFVGLCPFHEDHRASLFVSPAKQIFKCFACGAGGSVFQFLQLYEKQSFPEAVRAMAERASIPVPQDRPGAVSQEGPGKAELSKVTAFAGKFFRSQLVGAGGSAARAYIRGRGLTEESIERFALGYAPDSWDALLNAARRNGFGEAMLVTAGLAIRREGASGSYDRFRNRLMFPIYDATGTVIAFGGRAMSDEEQAKYINSPETALFDKSGNLYALNWAREAIVSSGQAVVVEGYLDALMPLQAGVGNVVATLGTSLTDRHVRLLLRYAREVVLVFDADAAGQAASDRALELFLAQRFQVKVATISSGKDPCDFVLAEGAGAFRALLAQAPDALQYAWAKRQQAFLAAGQNLADRRAVVEDFLRLVVSSATYGAIDEVRRGQLAQHIGHVLNISAADLQQQMRRLARQASRGASAGQAPAGGTAAPDPSAMTERQVLEVLLDRPDLFDQAGERIDPGDFGDEQLQVVARCVWQLAGQGRLNLEELMAMEALWDRGALLAELVTAGQRRGNYEETLAGAVEHMVYRRNRRDLTQLKPSTLSDEALRRLGSQLRPPDVRRRPGIS